MRSILLATALLCMGAFSACSSITVTSDYDTTVNFATLKTWSWFPTPGGPGSNAQGVVTLIGGRIKESVEGDLIARGYPYVASEGSFLVNFHAGIQQTIVGGAAPYTYGWRTGYAAAGPAEVYDEGTLLVDIIDPKTKTMIWRGSASAVVDPTNSTEKREEKIREAVSKILDQFPPKKK